MTTHDALELTEWSGAYAVTVIDIVDHRVGKIRDLFGIDHALFRRWGGALS